MSKSQTIHLAADLSHYHTDYLWTMPGSWEGYRYYSSPEFYEDLARTAARGVMDMLFFGDSGGTPEDFGGNHNAAVRFGAKWPRHDMTPMIPCMSRVGRRPRLRHHDVDDLSSSLPHCACFQWARPCDEGPYRLERRDVPLEKRGGELRF